LYCNLQYNREDEVERKYGVYSSRLFEKQFRRVPHKIRNDVELWIKAVEFDGINEVRKIPGYHDEPLQGKRFGQRSIRLTKDYRLFYKEDKNEKTILILEVNKHEY
jgi:proteic killer suppression protein